MHQPPTKKQNIYNLLGHIIYNLPHGLHLLQMLTSMVWMDHFILHGNIIPTEELHDLSTGMDKVGNIINDSIDCHLISLEVFNRPEGGLGCRIIGVHEIPSINLGGYAVA